MRISDWSSDVCSSDLQGDNRTGEGDGDDEQVKIILSKIPAEIDKVAIAVTIHEGEQRGQSFGQVSNAFIRAVDNKTGTEIVRYDLSEDASTETAMILGEVYRISEEHTSALQSLMRISYAVLCLKKNNNKINDQQNVHIPQQ